MKYVKMNKRTYVNKFSTKIINGKYSTVIALLTYLKKITGIEIMKKYVDHTYV